MSITQEQLRAIIFYEWHGGIGATAAAHNINIKLHEGATTIRTVKDSDFEDKPRSSGGGVFDSDKSSLSKTPPFSTYAVEEDPKINFRSFATRLGCNHSSVASRPLTTEKCWLDGSLTP
ncbi:hypothetical protein RB195_019574 [Necator americanus]|uniref:Mos1 transposase HTH domain-containing protein n=1 Tax=Necator americanus TaxID=51031 RepID=A0ABR1CEV7_NECAM